MNEREIVSIDTIIQNIEESIKTELGGEYTCFLPVLTSKNNEILIKFPIFKINTNSYEFTHLYTVAMFTGEIKEKEFLYDDKKVYDINNMKNINYSKVYDILTKFESEYLNNGFNGEVFLEYYTELIKQFSDDLKEIYITLLDDNKIKEKLLKEKIDFEWNCESGLKYLEDDILEFALWAVNSSEIRVYKENDRIKLENKIINLCDCEYSMKDIIEAINNKGILKNGKSIVLKKFSQMQIGQNINSVCSQCKYSRCPKQQIAYIKYLAEKDLLAEKLKEREEYRQNNKNNKFFVFEWNPEEGLKYIPQNMFEIADELVNRGYIWVGRELDKDGCVKIESAFDCATYKHFSTVKSIENLPKREEKWTYLTRKTDTKLASLCNTYSCRLDSCLFFIAGYIYYLRMSGQEEKIQEDRLWYKNNEVLVLHEIEKRKKEKIKDLKKQENEKVRKLENYRDKIENIDILLENLQSQAQNNLYCIIEGERGLGQVELVKKISDILKASNKIKDTEVDTKEGKTIQSATIEMPLQNLYSTLTSFNNGTLINYRLFEKNKLYVITGIEEFLSDYKTFKDSNGVAPHDELRKKQIKHIIKLLGRIEDDNYVIILGENKHIRNFLDLNIKIKNMYQECHLILNNLSLEEIYTEYKKNIKADILSILKKDEEKFKKKFIEFITLNKRALPFKNIELAEYLALYSNSRNKLVLPESIYKKETVEESLRNIIGLNIVKNKLKDFEKYMIFTNQAMASGLDIMSSNMHMIFTGNPGSGKTTIARIMAKMLFDMGILKENKLIEVDRKDLVGQYIGQTAPKTGEVIEKAMGGVLFIDEAYSLVPQDSSRDFGQEAVATLIKAMEDKKGEFVVIFAGYKNEMKNFVDSNPGIASRIGYTFDFPDYSAEELFEIFNVKITKMGFELSSEAYDEVKALMQYFCNVENIGNGRFVDKVLQETLIKHSRNGYSNIKSIVESDIPTVQEVIDVIYNKASMINPEDITEESKRKTAIHEVGHAVVRMLLFEKPGIKKITINAEGTGTLGYVALEEKGVLTQSKSNLLKRINIALAGMAAEEVYLGEFENGNSSDLKQATSICKHMITEVGMSSLGLGQITDITGEIAKLVQEEINSMLDGCFYNTKKLIQENKIKIDKVIDYLLEHGEITEEELIETFNS